MTNCPNCGAVREPAERRCPYCGTPYPKDRKTAQAVAVPDPEPVTVQLDGHAFSEAMRKFQSGILTPNEARRLMGLSPR